MACICINTCVPACVRVCLRACVHVHVHVHVPVVHVAYTWPLVSTLGSFSFGGYCVYQSLIFFNPPTFLLHKLIKYRDTQECD